MVRGQISPVLVDTCSLCPPGSATEGCPERLAPSKTLSGGAACGCPAATISCYDPLSSSETEACPESPGPSLGRTLRGSHLQFVASRPHLEGIGGCSKHLLGENVVVSGEAAVTNIHAMHWLAQLRQVRAAPIRLPSVIEIQRSPKTEPITTHFVTAPARRCEAQPRCARFENSHADQGPGIPNTDARRSCPLRLASQIFGHGRAVVQQGRAAGRRPQRTHSQEGLSQMSSASVTAMAAASCERSPRHNFTQLSPCSTPSDDQSLSRVKLVLAVAGLASS